ncbi:mutarotase [Massilia forsythiae]|uniref:Mutarotase n=1 Tax=Massilia forsythiae TaxID=2728020 RepID=A0A7Z2ZTK0_9BURK|nr:2'-5' RNA ligase family protein [Massilia forsythiae]QJE01464.1 mutarotase [Massilia forsythiae]
MHTDPAPHALQSHYDAIWERSRAAIGTGDIDCDARLLQGPDPRRGLTLIARPGAALAGRFTHLLERLDALEPGQYLHPAVDLHVTVLSLFTVGDDFQPQLARLDDYRDAVRCAVHGLPAFEIDFRGVTASRGAVLAQGYPHGDTLATLRDRLRAELRARALDASLDRRYRLVTAHATLLRFVRPLRQPRRFVEAIETLRGAALGVMRVERIELVVNDWYMSSASLRQVEMLDL